MAISIVIILVIGGLIIALLSLLLCLELWKKLWLVTSGEVVSACVKSNFAEGQRKGFSVEIQYRYVVKGREYAGSEIKELAVEYHQEREAIETLHMQFPVGGKVAVYFPGALPSLSSITPGGANIPKLLAGVLLAVISLYAAYAVASARLNDF